MNFIFGKSAAAVKLAELVSKNPSARRKVSSLLSEYTNQLLTITQAKDPKTVQLCMSMLRDYTLSRVEKTHIPHDIKTYTQNLVIARYRAYSHGFNDVSKTIQKLKNILDE